jgi:hypothetical protein
MKTAFPVHGLRLRIHAIWFDARSAAVFRRAAGRRAKADGF